MDRSELQLDYPCRWSYRIIGEQEARLRRAIDAIVGGDEHELEHGHQSTHGRYLTLVLHLVVRDEAHRLEVFQLLADHPDVRFVL